MEPEIGMGATLCVGSDRYPYTIVDIVTNKRTGLATILTMRADNFRLIGGSILSEHQEYEYTSDPAGVAIIVRKRSDGSWKVNRGETPVVIGVKNYYRDPSR